MPRESGDSSEAAAAAAVGGDRGIVGSAAYECCSTGRPSSPLMF